MLHRRWRRWFASWLGRKRSVVRHGQLPILLTELVLDLAEVAPVHLGRFVRRNRPGDHGQVGHAASLELGLELRGVAGPGLLADGPLSSFTLQLGLFLAGEGVSDQGDASFSLVADPWQTKGIHLLLLPADGQTIVTQRLSS